MSVVSDPVADFLTRLRNAAMARKAEVLMPYSKMKGHLAEILKAEGYITDFSVDTSGAHPALRIVQKYVNRTSAITGLKRISKPGTRRYVGVENVPRVLGGLGICILSTPQGLMTGTDAKRNNVGGELLAYVW